jgi:membrane protein YdbS with pleckstrin-like domain
MKQPSHRLDRRVLFLWWTVGCALALAAVVASAVWIAVVELPPGVAVGIGTIAILAAIGLPPLRFRRWRYEIRQRDILLSRGALFFVLTLIPFDRIQFVETRQGPLDRLFGLNQVVVFTAAGRAGRIPGLDPPEAESIREELSRVAGAQTV